ncbi:hypothetical protein A9X00_18260 [Mycobacterium sp. 1245805.9]|nr:hypothetical protein A9X00_18260 [Mycobacterium sp. 1245805.9]
MYRHVLQEQCERELFDGVSALSDVSADEWAAADRDYQERVAAEVELRMRAGEPVQCQSWELSKGFRAPFNRWPSNRGLFTVTADDRIVFKPREAR